MTNNNEPRALTAALSQPPFVTKGLGLAQHVADRHVDRWAPEGGAASRVGSLRNLGFVDRLVSPWIESAQRSASLRMFGQYISTATPERSAPSAASWVFPRPWYQDELDWMAAARHVNTQVAVEPAAAPTMLTTRGTYVAPTFQQIPSRLALPTTLHEYVAPALSVARPQVTATANSYSPLVPANAAHAAHAMTSAIAPLFATRSFAPIATQPPTLSPGLRAVLTTMLQRSSQAQMEPIATRSSAYAPEMVTPPAPRPDMAAASEPALQVAERTSEQRARIVELQRVAEREYQSRIAAATRTEAPATAARITEIQQRAAEQAARREEARQGDVRRDQAASTERAAATQTERARLEDRIAQRIAERTRQQEGQRLHETAREAAARDARIAATQTEAPVAAPAAAEAPRASAALAAAVASLPPELASMVASSIGGRPERAAQAIAELGEALRAVELMARNTAAGGMLAPSNGPRLIMPAGIGGLVATVERTTQPAGEQRAPRMFAQPAPAPIGQTFAAPARMPAMTWLSPVAARATTTSALGAAMQATPAALQHVAWSDRWLARFAGAQTQSLDVFSAASAASPELRASLLADAAPETVFVAPIADARRAAAVTAAPEPLSRDSAASSRAGEVVRYADDAETPDDVFAAIAQAATSGRAAQLRPASAPSPAQTAAIAAARATAAVAAATQAYDPAVAPSRETVADLVAHAAPNAPGAGLSAQLASSPFAPALRHILPLGVAPSFDVRALFGSSLGATYLSGMIASPTDQISIARSLPTWATIGEGPLTSIGGEPVTRDVAEWQPTYVTPESPASATSDEGDERFEAVTAAQAPLTTLRSALLSFDVETLAASAAAAPTSTLARTTATQGPTLAQTLVSAMSLPLLADTAAAREPGAVELAGGVAYAPSYGSPGQLADRAQSWSIAQERSTADLSFDFVSPELLLAARVYGLGPVEAAQATRLALAGPGQLTAMAGAVDRTFVQAMAIEAERRGSTRGRAITAFPIAMADGTAPSAAAPMMGASDDVATSTSYAASPTSAAAPSTSAFGVERRTPRGAFLWPAATTAALGLNALAPDSEQSMSVVALELLAAQAVAELGTYAALGGVTETERAALASVASRAPDGATYAAPAAGSSTTEPSDEEVLSSAAAFVPASRRDKFQSLYIALSQSPSGRVASPAARAARALALAGRGEETINARERASVAWDVLPVVFGEREREQEEPVSTGEAAARLVRRREELRAMDMLQVDSRPGLSGLASRAGEALSSYTSPSVAERASTSSARRGEEGAVLRAPTAAPELVQTGRPAGRHGGGELEIPAWFEQAARAMLSERTSISGDISLAELTLVTSAPPQQIAASSRSGGPSHASAPSGASGAAGEAKTHIDVDKLAEDIYREVLAMMDVARARNGEPYL